MQIDVENYPLEIKTDSALGSGDRMYMYSYTSSGWEVQGVHIKFTSTPQYKLYHCNSDYTDFSTTLPDAKEKVWRITRTRTSGIRLQIHCNDVEVLNIQLSDATCDYSSWENNWCRNVTQIRFSSGDSASDYYKLSHQGDHIVHLLRGLVTL